MGFSRENCTQVSLPVALCRSWASRVQRVSKELHFLLVRPTARHIPEDHGTGEQADEAEPQAMVGGGWN